MCWSCDHPTKSYDDYLTEVVHAAIDRYGWFVQGVGGSRIHPPFAYTVGLTALGAPELVLTGMTHERSAVVLNGMAAHWLHVDAPPGHGEHVETRWGHCVEVVDLPHPEAHLFTATAVYGEDAVAAQQLVWADSRGRWPWDRGFRGTRGGQPVLGPRATVRTGRCARPGAGRRPPDLDDAGRGREDDRHDGASQ